MSEKKLHIAILSTWFPAPGDTSGIFVRDQADALIEAGNKVSVFMFKYYSPLIFLKKKIKGETLSNWIPGKHIVPLAYNFTNFFPTRFSSNPIAIQKEAFLDYVERKFARYIKFHGKPDLIHHHGLADFCHITEHLHNVFNLPYVITEHSMFLDKVDHFNAYETTDERLSMIKNAAARITVSNFYKEFNEKLFDAPFIMIPNMINKDFETTALPLFPKKTDPFYFVNIGALSPHKGQAMLIKAFAEAFKTNKQIHLIIVGNGNLQEELEKLIASLGMQKQIELAGYKERNEVIKILDRSHVVVIASTKESFSMAAAESLFRGDPVLTTACKGPEDFIDASNGLICKLNDETDMREKLLAIHQKYSSYDYKQIAQRATEQFSEEAIVARLEELYRKVI
jgi:glycosyltransferase involved in cell wall biosynthesis